MGKGGKKKKGGPGEAGVKMSVKEECAFLMLQAETLERELQVKSAHAEEAIRVEMELRAKVEQMEQDFKEEQNTTFAVTADMARQYKALQEELIFKINSLETQLTEQKEELDIRDRELELLITEKDEEVDDKDKQIAQLNERMSQMSQEFANMLSETLELMRTQIGEKLRDSGEREGVGEELTYQLQQYSDKAYNTVRAKPRAIAEKADRPERSEFTLPPIAG
mmetsp:Transcript_100905/g.291834  ORF Transcript_100905/g.291834 Transcript_100905/m.291834 type:complete len:223 (+) Transcript_100905:101-769(+)